MNKKEQVLNELLNLLMEHYQSDELPRHIYEAFATLDITLNNTVYDDFNID